MGNVRMQNMKPHWCCRDKQTAADTSALSGGIATGAATFSFIQVGYKLLLNHCSFTQILAVYHWLYIHMCILNYIYRHTALAQSTENLIILQLVAGWQAGHGLQPACHITWMHVNMMFLQAIACRAFILGSIKLERERASEESNTGIKKKLITSI